MSQLLYSQVNTPSVHDIFNKGTAEERNAYMRSLGAKNILPPLPRSSHVRNRKTGKIYPWNELLAEQQELMECCDATGNTDPNAWMPTVATNPDEPVNGDLLQAKMLRDAVAQEMTSQYLQPNAPVTQPQEAPLPDNTVVFTDINAESVNKLLSMV